MKCKKTKIMVCLLTVFFVSLQIQAAETLIGEWNMDGAVVTKTVSVLNSNNGQGGGFINESRTVIESSYGDVVFGGPRAASYYAIYPASQTAGGLGASGEAGDKSLLVRGGEKESAFIGGVMYEVESGFKIELNFKLFEPREPANVGVTYYPNGWITVPNSKPILVTGGINRFKIELVTDGEGSGTAKLNLVCWPASGSAVSLETDFAVNVDNWNHVAAWLEGGNLYIQLNNGTVFSNSAGISLKASFDPALSYNGLTFGAWNGASVWPRAYLDNLKLYSIEPICGDWGYLKGDLDKDCKIDFIDIDLFIQQWLSCTEPGVTDCVNVNQ
ncbi:MAG: hypothetical protein A2Y10_17645 [Planctomycetes bacterium GWF2_41_51]|nr:MAG: hypothetical protein A2Y10_17645 [Planctomycetes bacterium GWF2_41_51]HBG28051.1 hypothetical protein [Phycisphaerales bacterium]